MLGDYEAFKKDFLRLADIDLNSYKENQMKRRIENFIVKSDVKSYSDFVRVLKTDASVFDSFVDHLTINVSEFYRNPAQWKTLEQTVIPELTKNFGKRLKVWSAACSTGDEPYSLAMVLGEQLGFGHFEIIATDMDKEVLKKAEKGEYVRKSVSGLPSHYQNKYIEDIGGGRVRVSDKLRSSITFKRHNLLRDPYPRDMHLIVCRNVMIYFTEDAKDEIYRKFSASLRPNGIFFVGSTEQIIGASEYGFKGIQSFFYEKQ